MGQIAQMYKKYVWCVVFESLFIQLRCVFTGWHNLWPSEAQRSSPQSVAGCASHLNGFKYFEGVNFSVVFIFTSYTPFQKCLNLSFFEKHSKTLVFYCSLCEQQHSLRGKVHLVQYSVSKASHHQCLKKSTGALKFSPDRVLMVLTGLSGWDWPVLGPPAPPPPAKGPGTCPSSAWDLRSLAEPCCVCAHLCPCLLGGPGTCTAELLSGVEPSDLGWALSCRALGLTRHNCSVLFALLTIN